MANSGLKLAPVLSDGMILQRDVCNRIYGTETKADMVTVSFGDKVYSTKVADDSDFSVELPPEAAGGPYSITVRGSGEVTISDIYFGDVYILSGQSNMQLPIRRVLDVSGDEVKSACEPEIRQYLIPAAYNFREPEKYMHGDPWKKAAGEDLMEFSAAGYFFAKEIREAYHVPVGLIMTAVGGCKIEAWMSQVTLRRFGNYEKLIKKFKDGAYFRDYLKEQQRAADEWLLGLEKEEQKAVNLDGYKQWDTRMVPSLLSDYGISDYSGSVYLCREVILDKEPAGEDACISMGSIIDSDQLWINNIPVGRTEYRYPPRKYLIQSGVLKKGKNLITVRIVINRNNGGTIKGKPYYLYCDGKKTDLSGKWYFREGKKADTAMPEMLFPPKLPVCFYNTVVAPTSKIAVKGILWYQGESNTKEPEDYAEKFSAMVADWRKLLGREVPFIYVQLANYREPLNTKEDTGWAELREQQRQNLSLPGVAMAAALDIGEENDLHPQNKKEVGIRLAKAAGYLIYNDTLEYSGPLPKDASAAEGKVMVRFDHLENSDEEHSLNNFELAGPDGIFHAASAVRRGDCVFAACEKVEEPVYVRYAWRDNPTGLNFYNAAGLPAPGFRLDIT